MRGRLSFSFYTTEETLDSDRLHIILTCLKDRDPFNYTNLGLALTSLQMLTATAPQRTHMAAPEETTKIYQSLIKLVEWPVASRVLGAANIAHVFAVLVALLEDARLRANTPAHLLSKLSTVAASIWMSWKSDETIVSLARRALVAINPHNYDSQDDEGEDHDDEENDEEHCSTTVESPIETLQDTLPASVSADSSVDAASSREGRGASQSPEMSKGPLQWDTTNQVHCKNAKVWADEKQENETNKDTLSSCQILAEGDFTGGSRAELPSNSANQELELQEPSKKKPRLVTISEPKQLSIESVVQTDYVEN